MTPTLAWAQRGLDGTTPISPQTVSATRKQRLLFISSRYLLPADSGGKIRTRDVLMGLKGGCFEVTLLSPCADGQAQADKEQLQELCDQFVSWPECKRGPLFGATRLRHVFSSLPISVVTDRSAIGAQCITSELAKGPHVVVVDFPHIGVLIRNFFGVPSVLFTHNVEAEIFRRHAEVAENYALKVLWRNQTAKMERFERDQFQRYDAVIAISERDKRFFESHYGLRRAAMIPTGVNLSIYAYQPPPSNGVARVMFSGSMDWLANIDAVEFFMDQIWPRVVAVKPDAEFVVVGRSPPAKLIDAARARDYRWTFTGFVDDVRPHVRSAKVCVIPLRVGGGTRLKVYESMAMGCPVVSTAIGVEGLPLDAGKHFELADTPEDFANAVIRLLEDPRRRLELAENSRRYVEEHCSHKIVAAAFEDICGSVCTTTRGNHDA